MIERYAKSANYRVAVNRYPGQLGTIIAGPEVGPGIGAPAKGGSFIAYCAIVDDKTISVIQGIDYTPEKGSVGKFSDIVNDAVLAARKK